MKTGSPENSLWQVQEWLEAGTEEHYLDPVLYRHEYKRRTKDIHYYRKLALSLGGLQRILDLGCGTGRLLIPLIRDGHTVVGIDRSLPMLRHSLGALSHVGRDKQKHAHLLQADMRQWPLTKKPLFSLILCAFHTFMHLYTRSDVEAFLEQVRCHLHPEGLLVFDLLNPDFEWLHRPPTRRWSKTSFVHPVTKTWWWYSTNHFYDPTSQIAYISIYYDPQHPQPGSSTEESRMVRLAHRQFFPAEIEALLHYNGFWIQRVDGDFAGNPFSPTSEEQIVYARLR